MTGSPKLSVCVPTYNRAEYLSQALHTLTVQTLREFELLVVDNCSTDGTASLVESLRNPRIRFHRNERNVGSRENWNRCLDLAGGEYVAICHDDDLYEPDFLRRGVSRRYLNRWGLTPQKPLRRAFEQDPEAVRRWLAVEYPAIRQQARYERAEIHWGDEMGLRSDHQGGRSYGLRGQTPVVPGTGQRVGCNMISTITNRGRLAFMVFQERFTARVFLRFLRRLLRHARRKVFLIVDRHPTHKAVRVGRWLQANRRHIRVFFLPAYSPDLNPDELLNQDVKTNGVGTRRPHNQAALLANVRRYLRSTQRQPERVQSYFRESHVRYAAR